MNEEKLRKLDELIGKSKIFAERIAPIYQMLAWTWGNEIPNKSQIEQLIINLKNDLAKAGNDYISSGGIVIRYNTIFDAWELLFQYSFADSDEE